MTCPYIVTGDEGTSYCRLAEQMANSQSTPNDRQIRSSPMDELRQASADLQPASLSPAAQVVRHAYGDCIGGVDAVMGSEWRGLAAALRALADQMVPVITDPRLSTVRSEILDIAAELEGGR